MRPEILSSVRDLLFSRCWCVGDQLASPVNLSWLKPDSTVDQSMIVVAIGTMIASDGEEVLESWSPGDDEV